MNAYSEVGAMNALVRALVVRLHRRKWLLLMVLALLMLIPGALTGAGVVSVLVVGGLVAAVLRLMGLAEERVAAFVFMLGILSAVAPPINVWAMLMAAGANMPYVGFDLVLLVPVLVVTAFTVVYLGWGAVPQSKDAILAGLPPLPPRMTWWRAAVPLVVLRRAGARGEVRRVHAADAGLPADLRDLRAGDGGHRPGPPAAQPLARRS